MKTLLIPSSVVALLTLCAPLRADEKSAVPGWDALPEAVRATASKLVGDAKIEEVEPSYEDGMHVHEVEYEVGGKEMAVVISPDGTLVKTEERMNADDAPEAIVAAVRKRFPEGKITKLRLVTKGEATFYEVGVTKASGGYAKLELEKSGEPVAAKAE